MKWCSNKKICGNCSQAFHDEQCIRPPLCLNCNELHAAWSRNCANFKKETAIIKYAVDNSVSFKIARERVQTNIKHQTFADSLKASTEIERLREQVEHLQKRNEHLDNIISELQASLKPKQPAQDHLIKLRNILSL